MEELEKVQRVIARKLARRARTSGSSCWTPPWARTRWPRCGPSRETLDLTGLVLTKMDSTAKGGIVVALKEEFDLPVKFIGVGEGIDDLVPFDIEAFAEEVLTS